MNKTLKIFTIILMAMIMICVSTQMVFAAVDTEGIVTSIDGKIEADPSSASDLTSLAGKVVGLIQIASAVAAVVLIDVFGFKFIMGSAIEKAD